MFLKTLFLGVLQGFTEFLPVSSSGHLALFQIIFGWQGTPLTYDVLLHFATMLATVIYFGRDIARLALQWFIGLFSADSRRSEGWLYGWAIILGTVMTVLIGLPLKSRVEQWMTFLPAVGGALLLTAAVLWLASRIGKGDGRVTLYSGLLIGIAQGIAVIPGISRSGMTIVIGLLCGLSSGEAFRFSFLLSLPAILGASILQIVEVGMSSSGTLSLPQGWLWGGFAAFTVGLLALATLRRLVTLGRWHGFSIYCASVGIFVILLNFWR